MNFIALDIHPDKFISNNDYRTNNRFLADYVMYNYTVDINTVSGQTYWDKFVTIYNANK